MEQMVADAAERIFRDQCTKTTLDAAEDGQFPAGLWQLLCENGFQFMALPDSGTELAEVFAVLRVAGRFAAPLPLAEALRASIGDTPALAAASEAVQGVRVGEWANCELLQPLLGALLASRGLSARWFLVALPAWLGLIAWLYLEALEGRPLLAAFGG